MTAKLKQVLECGCDCIYCAAGCRQEEDAQRELKEPTLNITDLTNNCDCHCCTGGC